MHRIRRIEQLLQGIHGCRLETDVGGPRAIGQKAPLVQTEHHVDRRIHRAPAQMRVRKRQFVWRIREFTLYGVKGKILITKALASHMPRKSWTSRRSADLPFPSRASRDHFDRVMRFRFCFSKRVDEIAIALERAGFKSNVNRRVSRREDSPD